MSFITQQLWSGALSLAKYCPNCALNGAGGHGTGPRGAFDLAIVAAGAVILSVALLLALRFLLRPGERSPTHVKWTVLDDAAPPRREGSL
jgi:hypothetical protein